MLPESKVEALQVHGPVMITRHNGRWNAAWHVIVRINEGPKQPFPNSDGTTPYDAVNNLWNATVGVGQSVSFGDIKRFHWNSKWQEEASL